ncbi:hypothetical protein [Phycicoccus sp. 3266]|uniref:hypothetical protein n=1 Tax=Phycicoccus sp. 3266 TaxID=2817751 RepID=UPI0028549058|nr:hypothetical protein [Phycicoccus sp. 3266]MDR6863506.1 hypothetical protein [Phycicoccus sp. 3266]
MSARSRPRLVTTGAAAVLALVATASTTACGGPDGLQGRVVTVAKGRTGAAVPGGWVAVLTDDQLRDYLSGSGLDTPPDDQLGYVSGRVLHEGVGRAGGTLVTVDDKGQFLLRTTGRRVLCLLYPAGQVDLLDGCAAVDLPAEGTLTVGTGDAGVTASVRR